MKKQASKKKTVKKLKPTAHKLGHHPDLRTKAGRAWKARREASLVRAEARNARIKQAAYEKEVKAAVTGGWVDLKDRREEKLKALATAFGMGADRLHRLIEEERAEEVRNLVAAADTPPRLLTNVPADMEKLKASGMYWELFPNGHTLPYLSGTTGDEPQYQQDGTQRVSPFMENRADLAGSICGAYSRVMV